MRFTGTLIGITSLVCALGGAPAIAQTPSGSDSTVPQTSRPINPSTGQTVPDPQRAPAGAETRPRDTGAASGAAGPNIPGTGTPRITTDVPR